ncbi:MAG: cyclic nucleotide-binding domain-containing protein [Planctomycetota bacterium]
MTDADVDWLLQQAPFADLNASAFPKSMPLDGVLKHDCRLRRFQPGEVIVREGDYANSAFLVLSGQAELITRSLPPETLGRSQVESVGWASALWQFLKPSGIREARRPDQVTAMNRDAADDAAPSQWNQANPDAPTLFLQDFDGIVQAGHTVTLHPGELFGEVAAMYRSPRSATIVAGQPTVALEIRLQGLKALQRDRGFADAMETHYRQTWLALHLREVPLFRYVPPANLARVVSATAIRSFGRMQWNTDYAKSRKRPPEEQIANEPVVATEGHHVTDLIIVRSGFGRVCQNYGTGQRTTAYLGKGHLFALNEIATTVTSGAMMPLQNSLHAVGFLDTLHVPVEIFATEILPHVRRTELPPAAAQAMMASDASGCTIPPTTKRQRRREQRSDAGRADHQSNPTNSAAFDQPESTTCDVVTLPTAPPTWDDLPSPTGTTFEPTGLLEFIVQNRFNNGEQAMVIDLHRCTRCDDCVKACAAVHDGNPRFARIGPAHERLQFVNACMQCSDPVCMIGCPTGAIHRDEATGVVQISEPICIGCGVCANSCPYDNIDMVQIRSPDGRLYTDEKGKKPIQKATKCDMCAGLPTGPACQAACAHDALVRIDLSESPPLEDWLRRRT